MREPTIKVLFSNDLEPTVTIHVENGIQFRLDVSKCMFSSGNGTERIHFGKLRAEGEVFESTAFDLLF